MPTIQHIQLSQGSWQKYTFIEQMANIGSEVERSFKWKSKMKETLANQAFTRATELLNFTIQAHLSDTNKMKELLRLRECLFDSFAFDNQYGSSDKSWHSYFRAFNYAARLKI